MTIECRKCQLSILIYSGIPKKSQDIKYLRIIKNLMECTSLQESLDRLRYAGICIGAEKTLLLKNSLLVLQKENHFVKTYYWGRINGIQKYYYIAYGHGKECLEDIRYYYSLNCIDWLLLPKFNDCEQLLTTMSTNLFFGDPSIMTNVDVPDYIFKSFIAKEKTRPMTISKDLKEESRLAVTIQRINESSMIVPRRMELSREYIQQMNINIE